MFLTIENHLDVEVRLKELTLDIEASTERFDCRYLGFLPVTSTARVELIDDVAVPARQAIKGWVLFQHKDGMRIADFGKFIFTAQAIGEPKQTYGFEPYDWDHARKGNSKLVMLPLGKETNA